MKNILFIAFILVLAVACTGKKELTIEEKQNELEDSISYELIVLDPGFDSWYAIHGVPAKYRSQSYYEGWNQRYVNAWNYQRMGYRYAQLIEGNIDYQPNTDYGFELNHKLFYYFMYVENELEIQLIPDGPKTY